MLVKRSAAIPVQKCHAVTVVSSCVKNVLEMEDPLVDAMDDVHHAVAGWIVGPMVGHAEPVRSGYAMTVPIIKYVRSVIQKTDLLLGDWPCIFTG
jgi:hypothetical protein